jgi:mono/diheme cytochrome c family protein
MNSVQTIRSTFFSMGIALSLMLVLAPRAAHAGNTAKERALVDRGRYVVQVGGCNDCHTPGYGMADGNVPEKEWLIGDQLGFRGPWGTTYASNLRSALARMSEAEWLEIGHNARYRPPMPSVSLRLMSKRDLRAVYHYVRSLAPSSNEVPAYVPPDRAPVGPVVLFPSPPN